MNAIEYYKSQFGRDLLLVMGQPTTPGANRLSILCLADFPGLDGGFGECAARFRGLESRTRFLFCYYFSALIDQAIHCRLRELHGVFDHYARYPKFCGILGSYWTNYHPNFLLLLATLFVEPEDEPAATKDFADYAAFFPADYCVFLREQLPKLANVRPEDDGKHWCEVILDEVQTATHFVPRSLPIVQRSGNDRLVGIWLQQLRSEVSRLSLDSPEIRGGR